MNRSRVQILFGRLRASLYARVTLAYAATAFVLLQVGDLLFADLNLPSWSNLLLFVLLLVGFPIALAITWAVAPDPGKRPKKPGSPSLDRLDSLAVLPFVDLSPGGDHQYLGDGLTEELLSSLSGIPGLRVPARTSSFAAKAGGGDVRQIGRDLGVEAVLEGSVRSEARRLRIAAQLIEVDSGFQIWSHVFQVELTGIFEVQERIARGILDALQIRLPSPAAAEQAPDPIAYDRYLKGRHCWHRGSRQSLETAVALFEEAASIDPGYAAAYCGLADALVSLGNQTYVDPKVAYPRARSAAEKAIELDGGNADANALLGLISFIHDWDVEAARSRFSRAVTLDRASVSAHYHYARFLCAAGDYDGALDHGSAALALDPLSVPANVLTAVVQRCAGRHDESLAQLERARLLFPDEFRIYYALTFSLAYAGKPAEAVEAAEHAARVDGGSVFALGALGYAQACAGATDKARTIVANLKDEASRHYVCPYDIALIHVALGDVDESIDWLERAFAVRDHALLFINADGGLDPVRTDPRFVALAEKIWPARP